MLLFLSSTDSTARTGHENGGDWQGEVYQKIKAMKETYFSELNEIHQKIAAKLLQVEVGLSFHIINLQRLIESNCRNLCLPVSLN
ncbi:mediator of RNA polymerase II transcription subunit 15a [Gossypium raimondii]|uniref:mediator of RNA polymerase II transcription subunit 15a n=1 Tax=Gossypium raimondii TaxID=29730 RepID=UPI00227AFD3B|nr:mediator of RNA polymerase II transcription subunit 15a [Gossypium raimondii]